MNACSRWSFLAVALAELAALGCSSPVPFPAKGAISLSVQKPSVSVNQMDCPDSGHLYEVGASNTAPSKVMPGERMINGEGGAEISCSVHDNGSSFTFSGSFHGVTNDSNHYPITVTFSNGTVGADQAHGTATVAVYTPVLAGTLSSSQPCSVDVINKQVKGGSIWATFSCPSISAPPSYLCRVGESVIVFENCDGS